MKIWIRLLIGAILGVVFGIIAPETQRFMDALAWLEHIVIRVGRYALVPILFFSISIAVFELRKEGAFWPLLLKNVLAIAGVSALVIAVGVIATLIFQPARIPILPEQQLAVAHLDVAGGITELFPFNMFAALAGDGVFLLPIYVFAFFLGVGLSYDKIYSKPVVNLIDSLSRIFFHISSFFIEILGFMMIVLSAYWAVRFRGAARMEVFNGFMAMLAVLALVIAVVILPLFLYLIKKPRRSPWAIVYGSLGPAITAFFSGDINFSLPVLLKHSKENFGVRRRSAAVTLSMFATFCRGGSAMVAVAAFIVIFNSYSSIGIGAAEIMSVSLHALLISFLLARHPGGGAYIALTLLCIGFGRGFEEGFLILRPIAFFLIAIGTFIDVMIASLANYALAQTGGNVEEKPIGQWV